MRIIINADDFGISKKVNEAIFDSVTSSRLTSITTIANGPAVNEAIKIYQNNIKIFKNRSVSMGVHLDALEFKPMTSNSSLDLLLNDSGCFNGDVLRRIKINSEIRKAVLGEWQEQIQFLRSNGFQVSHIDSHSHTHTIPGLFPVLIELLKYHKNLSVRISLNLYPYNPRKVLQLKKFIFNNALRKIFKFKTTDFFTSFDTFFKITGGMKYVPSIYKKKDLIFELMIHPGGDYGEEIRSGFKVSENDSFNSEWQNQISPEINLISYNDLI